MKKKRKQQKKYCNEDKEFSGIGEGGGNLGKM